VKKISRSLVLLLGFVLIFSMTVLSAPSDLSVNDKIVQEAIDTLKALNIMNDIDNGMLKPETEVTRGEFAAIIGKMLNIQYSSSFELYSILSSMGIMSGYQGDFMPSENITYEQSIKSVVCALGYEIMAKSKGGYPIGYCYW